MYDRLTESETADSYQRDQAIVDYPCLSGSLTEFKDTAPRWARYRSFPSAGRHISSYYTMEFPVVEYLPNGADLTFGRAA